MTTSRTKIRPSPQAAFSLLELLLVLALAVVLAALAAPAFEGALSRTRLDSAAERLASAWGEARLEAIRTGEPVAFRCELGTPTYRVGTLSAMWETTPGVTSQESNELSSVVFKQLSLGEPGDLPPADPTVAAVLVFQPSGVTSDAYAILESAEGDLRRVELRGLTCASSIEAIGSESLLAGAR